MSTLIPCIVAGGAGTRLWPVSREAMPKPFMRLADGLSLLQKTFERVAGLDDVTRLLTVINRELLFRTLDDYRPLNRGRLGLDFSSNRWGATRHRRLPRQRCTPFVTTVRRRSCWCCRPIT